MHGRHGGPSHRGAILDRGCRGQRRWTRHGRQLDGWCGRDGHGRNRGVDLRTLSGAHMQSGIRPSAQQHILLHGLPASRLQHGPMRGSDVRGRHARGKERGSMLRFVRDGTGDHGVPGGPGSIRDVPPKPDREISFHHVSHGQRLRSRLRVKPLQRRLPLGVSSCSREQCQTQPERPPAVCRLPRAADPALPRDGGHLFERPVHRRLAALTG